MFSCCRHQAEHQKKAAIVAAEGDARGAEMIAQAFQDVGEGLIELRKLEAAEEIAETISVARNISYLPHGQNLLLNMPVNQ